MSAAQVTSAHRSRAKLQKASEHVLRLAGSPAGQQLWVLENLTRLADGLAHKKRIEDERPKKAELRKQLYRIEQAAKVIDKSIGNLSVIEITHAVSPFLTPKLGSMRLTLQLYAAAAKKAAEIIPPTAGATRVKPPLQNLLDSMGWCALIICEVWFLLHGEHPGETNPEAQEAANLLWDAASGKTSDMSIERWARHFVRAKKCKDDWQALHIRGHLSLEPLETLAP